MPISPLVGAQLIGSGAGIASSVAGGIFQTIQGNRQQQREMEYNERMIDKQNAYNSPANQMRLLREAGLNPNAILGGNTLSGAIQAAAPSSPEAKKAQWDMIGGEIANLTQDAALKAAQVESIRHETERQDDVHAQEYGEDGYKSKYFELSSTTAAAQRALWGSQVDTNKAMIRNYDDMVWDRSFSRIQESMITYMDTQEQKLRMRIAANSEERAAKLFPLTLKNLSSEIGVKNAQAKFYLASSAKLATEHDFFRRSNLMNFVDGVTSIDRLGIPEKKGLIALKYIYNQMELEAFRGVTERRNWDLIDSRIHYLGAMSSQLGIKTIEEYMDAGSKGFEFGMEILDAYDTYKNRGSIRRYNTPRR